MDFKRAAVVLAALTFTGLADANILYTQPTDGAGGPISLADGSNGPLIPATAYDNFTLSANASIGEISYGLETRLRRALPDRFHDSYLFR